MNSPHTPSFSSHFFLTGLLIAVLMPALTHAESAFLHDTILGGRGNPAGLKLQTTGKLQVGLYESDSKLLEQNFVAPSLMLSISPANAKVGVGLTLQPLSILAVYAEAAHNQFFGSFRRLQSFDTIEADFSDEVQEARAEEGLNYSAGGLQLTLGGRFQVKAGPVAVVANVRGIWQEYELQGSDSYFYESELDVLAQNGGWLIHSDVDALYFLDEEFILGFRHTLVSPIYDNIASDASKPSPNHRVGPLLIWVLEDSQDQAGMVEKIMLVGMLNWYLDHTYRAGASTSAAIPYLAFGVKVSGELFSSTPSP